MYLRPSLPQLFDSNLILWIDSDCWVQRLEAVDTYLDGAIRFPGSFTICPILDVDYPRCIQQYLWYQNMYVPVHEKLFGKEEADFLFGKAIFSSGVFAAHWDSPVWSNWRHEVRQLYEQNEHVRAANNLAHLGEQQALNKVLHRTGAFNCVTADMNWHCHCSEVVRDDARVRVVPSGREPAIVHLCMFPERGEEYRAKRLLYEPRSDRIESPSEQPAPNS
jgi:hypothetical protein